MYRLFLLFHLLFSLSCLADCKDLSGEDWSTLAKLVAKDFPGLEQKRYDIEIADNNLNIAEAAFDPVLKSKSESYLSGYYSGVLNQIALEKQSRTLGSKIDLGLRDGSGQFPDYEGMKETSNGGEIFAGITIPLLKNLSIDQARFNESKKLILIDLKRIELELEENLVLEDFINSIINTVFLKKIKKELNNLISQAKDQRKYMQTKADIGAIATNDLLEMDRFLAEYELKLSDTNNKLDQQIYKINTFYLQPIRKTVSNCSFANEFSDKLVVEDSLSRLIKVSFKKRPDLRILTKQLKIAQIELEFLSNQQLPELNLRFEYENSLGTGPSEFSQDQFKGMFELSYPIFNRQAKAETKINNLEQDKIESGLQLLKNSVNANIYKFLTSVNNSSNLLAINLRQIKYLDTLAQSDRTAFQEGSLDIFRVNQRQAQVISTRIERYNLLAEYFSNIFKLYFFTNEPKRVDDIFIKILP